VKTPELRVQLTKRADGSAVLRCVRRDGSSTWQVHKKHADFFPFHDLRHFALETTLGFGKGFYGLIADGWDIEDTTGKGARGKLSAASVLVEHAVGLLDRENAGGAPTLTAVEFNTQIDIAHGVDPGRVRFADDQLTKVRNRTQELHEQWTSIPAGSTLELTFSRE
jgi:hypothetical protein